MSITTEQRIKSFSLTHIYCDERSSRHGKARGWEMFRKAEYVHVKRCHTQQFVNFVAKIRKSVWRFDRAV